MQPGFKDLYKELCEAEGSDIPLFLHYWWMEAVCKDKQWDVALVFSHPQSKSLQTEWREGSTIVGAMPYLFGKRCGMRYVLQPQLTQYSGPWYRYPEGQDNITKLDFEKNVSDKLLEQIHRLKPAYIYQHFSPQVTNWLPFHWQGFSQSTRYTYIIEDLSDLDKVYSSFDNQEKRKKIERLENAFTTELLSPESFADMHAAYWKSKGKDDELSRDFIVNLCSAAIQRGQGAIVALRDESGAVAAARFVAWDASCAHSLLSCRGTAKSTNGVTELLVWRAIQHVAPHARSYDFEGSMDQGIERFYRYFGAKQVPYFQITKCSNPLFRLLLWAKKCQQRRKF